MAYVYLKYIVSICISVNILSVLVSFYFFNVRFLIMLTFLVLLTS